MQYIPPAPPAPPKKRKIWPWVVGTIIVVLVLQAAAQTTTDPEPVTPAIDPALTEDPDVQIGAARVAWDTAITQADRDAICDYYNTPPVGTTPELVETFAENADMSYDDAERVLNQLLAEKC
jgi:hypothetical protein